MITIQEETHKIMKNLRKKYESPKLTKKEEKEYRNAK